MIFILFSVNSAMIAFVVTFSLNYLPSSWLVKILNVVIYWSVMLFGPVLMIVVVFAYINFKNIVILCSEDSTQTYVNYLNLFTLIGATMISIVMSFVWSA